MIYIPGMSTAHFPDVTCYNVALLLNLFSFCKDFSITILSHTLQFDLFINFLLCIC